MTSVEIPTELFLPPSKTPRSEGIHVSAIIRAIATETGILKPEWAEELSLVDVRRITDPVAVLRISIGLAWEQYYIPEILGPAMGVIDHPGEMQVDGVYMTHDGESLDVIVTEGKDTFTPVVHEIKATYKSTRTVGDLSGQFMWLAQMKAYCKGLGCRHAFMHTLFLCGDYSYPIKPLLKKWLVTFTQEEIEDNWELLMRYKAERLAIENAERREE